MVGEKLPLGEVLSFGWGAFKQRAGFWIGVAAILFGLTIVYQVLGGIFAGVFGGSGLLLGVISLALLAAYVYLQTRLTVGITSMALATADGGTPGYESLLAKPHLLMRYFLAYMLFSIATGIGFLLLVIPGVYLLIRFGLFGFAIVDREVGVVESFNASSALTEGYRWDLLLIGVVLFLLNAIAAIPFGLGLLITLPITILCVAHIYRRLERAHGRIAPRAPTPIL